MSAQLEPPLVTVITPSYNHAPYIRQTIESVLAQEYPRVEHIVIDGASTDGTPAILAEYAARHPERFRYRSAPDRGQSDAFNRGLALARGEFVGWQNSDDYYLPGAFAAPVAYLQAHPDVAAVYGDCPCLDDAGREVARWLIGPYDYARLLEIDYIPNQAALIRRSALQEVGGLDVDLHYTMDYDLWLRLGLAHRIAYLPGRRGVFRILDTAKSQSGFYRNLMERAIVVERILRDPSFPEQLRVRGRRALMRHIAEAFSLALVECREDADESLRLAIAHDPALEYGDYLIETLLNRSLVYAAYPADVHIPQRAATLLAQAMLGGTPSARQLTAIAHLYQAADGRRKGQYRAVAAHLTRALAMDRAWLRHGSARLLLLRTVLGSPTVDVARAALRGARRLVAPQVAASTEVA